MAAGQWLRRHRRKNNRGPFDMVLAMSAGIFEAHVLPHRDFDLDVQLLAYLFADRVHLVVATRAALLVLRQIVFDALARQMRRQWLATALAGLGLASFEQPGIRQLG